MHQLKLASTGRSIVDVFTAKIDAISQQQVNDALKQRINPDRLLTVIVGG